MSRHPRPGPARRWLSRFRSRLWNADQARVAAGNYWFKIRHAERCCGNPGQPGC